MKVLVSDYDGTLRLTKNVAKETIKAITNFQKQGNVFVVNTGRSINGIYPLLIEQDIHPDFTIGNNGAMIVDKDGKELLCKSMNFDTAVSIKEYLDQQKIKSYSISNGYDSAFSESIINRVMMMIRGYRFPKMSFKKLFKEKKIVTIVARGKNSKATKQIAEDIMHKYDDVVAYANMWVTDIIVAGVSKKTGIDFLKDKYGYKEIYCIGDDFNDISMIQGYKGFAMASGIDEVKKYATKEFKNVKECIDYLLKEENK